MNPDSPPPAARIPDAPAPPSRTPADVVPVRLHTRRGGELQWQDRGRAFVPREVVSGRADRIRYDGVAYVVEDVFDDGRTVAVWVRAARNA